MKSFMKLASIATFATYCLIFVGGLVRVSGAGLGCPDWPKCFGSWIPPLNISQLPTEIDPNLFNFTLAWIEYINRLFGMTVGMLIAVVAFWALIKFTKQIKIVVPSALAGVLVAFEGWQGSQVVASGLEPIIVSAHLVIAFIIASLLLYVTQQAYYQTNPDTERESSYPEKTRAFVGILWILSIIQVVLGTQFRESVERAIIRFPLLSESDLLMHVGWVKVIHPLLGIAVAVLRYYISIMILGKSKNPSSLNWQSAWAMLGLVVISLFLGLQMVAFGINPVAQVLHLWVSALMVGVVLISYTALGHKQETL